VNINFVSLSLLIFRQKCKNKNKDEENEDEKVLAVQGEPKKIDEFIEYLK